MKILIIEDETLILQSLKRLLSKKGHEVDTAMNGKLALEKIFAKQYDRIICDLMLGDITGFDIIEESKKVFSPQQISKVFVIISAYSSAQVLEQAQKYSCNILNKPFENMVEALKIMCLE